jgi:hypothetical protein
VTATGDGAPADTVPPFTGEAHDVAIDVSVTTPSSSEQVWSGTLPTGEAWKVQLTRIYDSISFWPEVNGASQGSSSGSTVRRPAGQEFACCMPLNVITADPKAAAMRVTSSNGGRYTIPLHDLPGGDGLRIALLALPDGGGPAHADLIDADGNVLRSM